MPDVKISSRATESSRDFLLHLIVVETAFGGGSDNIRRHPQINIIEIVFALPGKITDIYSQGCNHLIFQEQS